MGTHIRSLKLDLITTTTTLTTTKHFEALVVIDTE